LGNEFYSVQPTLIKSKTADLYTENRRVVLFVENAGFGKFAIVIVGATATSSIKLTNPELDAAMNTFYNKKPINDYSVHTIKDYKKDILDLRDKKIKLNILDFTNEPTELGQFHFGGSTLVTIIPHKTGPNTHILNKYIKIASDQGVEVKVDIGVPLVYAP
jgi:phosphatidylserine decarboxylase